MPGHSTIDGKVEREGEANDGIDDDDNVLGNIIVKHKETQTKTIIYQWHPFLSARVCATCLRGCGAQ